MFRLTIDVDNDAFHPDPSNEIARLLREAAEQIERDSKPSGMSLRDINGNRVGGWDFSK